MTGEAGLRVDPLGQMFSIATFHSTLIAHMPTSKMHVVPWENVQLLTTEKNGTPFPRQALRMGQLNTLFTNGTKGNEAQVCHLTSNRYCFNLIMCFGKLEKATNCNRPICLMETSERLIINQKNIYKFVGFSDNLFFGYRLPEIFHVRPTNLCKYLFRNCAQDSGT